MILSRIEDRRRRRRFAPSLTRSSTRTECCPCDQGRFLGLNVFSSCAAQSGVNSACLQYGASPTCHCHRRPLANSGRADGKTFGEYDLFQRNVAEHRRPRPRPDPAPRAGARALGRPVGAVRGAIVRPRRGVRRGAGPRYPRPLRGSDHRAAHRILRGARHHVRLRPRPHRDGDQNVAASAVGRNRGRTAPRQRAAPARTVPQAQSRPRRHRGAGAHARSS